MNGFKGKAIFVLEVAAAVALITLINTKFPIPVVGAFLPKN